MIVRALAILWSLSLLALGLLAAWVVLPKALPSFRIPATTHLSFQVRAVFVGVEGLGALLSFWLILISLCPAAMSRIGRRARVVYATASVVHRIEGARVVRKASAKANRHRQPVPAPTLFTRPLGR